MINSNPIVWLLTWSITNVSVTLLNKASFDTIFFPYPFFLSFVHMICNSFGSFFLFYSGNYYNVKEEGIKNYEIQTLLGPITQKKLTFKETRIIILVSVLFSLNIAFGNISLRYVSVNFNQVMRSLVPAITIGISICVGHSVSRQRQVAVLPVVIGVMMATYGDLTYSNLGLAFTILCIIFASLKVVISGALLTGSLKLHPIDLIHKIAPFATIQCGLLSFFSGEISEILTQWKKENCRRLTVVLLLLISGICAFILNITSFMTNKLTSPLTLCIASNAKQVLMIALGTIIFGTRITILNGLGILIVLLGSARYSYLCMKEKTNLFVQEFSSTIEPHKRNFRIKNDGGVSFKDETKYLLLSLQKDVPSLDAS